MEELLYTFLARRAELEHAESELRKACHRLVATGETLDRVAVHARHYLIANAEFQKVHGLLLQEIAKMK